MKYRGVLINPNTVSYGICGKSHRITTHRPLTAKGLLLVEFVIDQFGYANIQRVIGPVK